MTVPWVITQDPSDPQLDYRYPFRWRCAYCGRWNGERTETNAIFYAASHVLTNHMPSTWLHENPDDDLYSGVIASYAFAPDVA